MESWNWRKFNMYRKAKTSTNLVYVSQLSNVGCVVTFNADSWKITKGNLVIAWGKRDGTLYITYTQDGSPGSMWTISKSMDGKQVKLLHLRVSGCITYVHVNDNERSKLDVKSKICTFLGYGGDQSRAYIVTTWQTELLLNEQSHVTLLTILR